ncbi:AAA family ATPase [Psychrosphaera aestuarii]|uniref:AAA family ATPase n=1 Tax=Psychrosphaera aestuarii TaxID=1266052 RepID=UPI001B33D00F|nr:AAA family ATPase [Psychrosphaera aestuarii]
MTNNTLANGFYIPPSRLQFLETVQELLAQTGIVAMEGAVGIGKTTLLEELLTSALPNANKCYLTATNSLNDIQVRSRIIEQLFGNVLFDPEKPLLNAFLEFSGDSQILLAIDNGHFLSGQLVGELLQVVAEFKKRGLNISVLIAFDKQISKTLASITSAMISVLAIPRFNEKESYTLLKQSFENLPSADSTKVKRWIENSQGNPIQLLGFDTSDSFKVVSPLQMNLKLWVSSLVLVSLLLAIGVYVYRQYLTSSQTLPKPLSESTVKSIPEPIVSDWSSAKVKKQVNQAKLKDGIVDKATRQDIVSALQVSMQPETPVKEAVIAPIDTSFAEDTPDSIEHLNRENNPVNEGSQILTQVSEAAIDSTENKTIEPENGPKQSSDVLPPIEVLKVAGYEINNSQMMSLPSSKYVLQLTAVSQESTLESYLKARNLDSTQTRIYKISRNNSDWLVVTYGVFDTISSARETAKKIDNNAWAKSVDAIQQQIKSFNESISQ